MVFSSLRNFGGGGGTGGRATAAVPVTQPGGDDRNWELLPEGDGDHRGGAPSRRTERKAVARKGVTTAVVGGIISL